MYTKYLETKIIEIYVQVSIYESIVGGSLFVITVIASTIYYLFTKYSSFSIYYLIYLQSSYKLAIIIPFYKKRKQP